MKLSKRLRDEFRELGRIGGKECLKTMTDEQRKQRAKKAAEARWAKEKAC